MKDVLTKILNARTFGAVTRIEAEFSDVQSRTTVKEEVRGKKQRRRRARSDSTESS